MGSQNRARPAASAVDRGPTRTRWLRFRAEETESQINHVARLGPTAREEQSLRVTRVCVRPRRALALSQAVRAQAPAGRARAGWRFPAGAGSSPAPSL